MQIAKITLWDGRTFYTNDYGWDRLKQFFDNVRAETDMEKVPVGARNQVDLIEMTPEEYQAIPATMDSYRMFGQVDSGSDK